MNQKTVRQLRTYAREAGQNFDALKRRWNETPWNARHAFRLEMINKGGPRGSQTRATESVSTAVTNRKAVAKVPTAAKEAPAAKKAPVKGKAAKGRSLPKAS